MSNGLIGSLINPNAFNRGELMQRGSTAMVPAVANKSPVSATNSPGLQRANEQTSELPRSLNRVGPRDVQAMSQYAEFSGQTLAGVGSGFSAIV